MSKTGPIKLSVEQTLAGIQHLSTEQAVLLRQAAAAFLTQPDVVTGLDKLPGSSRATAIEATVHFLDEELHSPTRWQTWGASSSNPPFKSQLIRDAVEPLAKALPAESQRAVYEAMARHYSEPANAALISQGDRAKNLSRLAQGFVDQQRVTQFAPTAYTPVISSRSAASKPAAWPTAFPLKAAMARHEIGAEVMPFLDRFSSRSGAGAASILRSMGNGEVANAVQIVESSSPLKSSVSSALADPVLGHLSQDQAQAVREASAVFLSAREVRSGLDKLPGQRRATAIESSVFYLAEELFSPSRWQTWGASAGNPPFKSQLIRSAVEPLVKGLPAESQQAVYEQMARHCSEPSNMNRLEQGDRAKNLSRLAQGFIDQLR